MPKQQLYVFVFQSQVYQITSFASLSIVFWEVMLIFHVNSLLQDELYDISCLILFLNQMILGPEALT